MKCCATSIITDQNPNHKSTTSSPEKKWSEEGKEVSGFQREFPLNRIHDTPPSSLSCPADRWGKKDDFISLDRDRRFSSLPSYPNPASHNTHREKRTVDLRLTIMGAGESCHPCPSGVLVIFNFAAIRSACDSAGFEPQGGREGGGMGFQFLDR